MLWLLLFYCVLKLLWVLLLCSSDVVLCLFFSMRCICLLGFIDSLMCVVSLFS